MCDFAKYGTRWITLLAPLATPVSAGLVLDGRNNDKAAEPSEACATQPLYCQPDCIRPDITMKLPSTLPKQKGYHHEATGTRWAPGMGLAQLENVIPVVERSRGRRKKSLEIQDESYER